MATVWAKTIGLGLLVGMIGACDRPTATTAPLDTNPAPPAPDMPPPPPPGAYLGQLPPEQTAQLQGLGVEVIVPGEVPPEFSVVEVRLDQGDGGEGYFIVYQSPAEQCFAVEFAAAGIGSPPATTERDPIDPPLFTGQDYGLNYGEFEEEGLRSQFPGQNLYTDWLLGRSGAYRLVGASYIQDLFPDLADCQDVPPAAAVALVESFTVLTPEPLGDGPVQGM
jgi:hypothetical protein